MQCLRRGAGVKDLIHEADRNIVWRGDCASRRTGEKRICVKDRASVLLRLQCGYMSVRIYDEGQKFVSAGCRAESAEAHNLNREEQGGG